VFRRFLAEEEVQLDAPAAEIAFQRERVLL